MKEPHLSDFYDESDPRGCSSSEYNEYASALRKWEIETGEIKVIKDTPTNRDILRKLIGEPIFECDNYAYIEYTSSSKKWKTTFTFQWLYRPNPILTDINELIKN